MKKLIIATIGILGLAALVGAIFLFVKLLRPKVSGLAIESTPSSTVFINGQKVGNTPFRSKDLTPSEISVRLIPVDSQTTFTPFDTKLNLAAGIETVLRHEFAQNEESSSTELLSFEKINDKDTSIELVSMPTGAQVIIDEGTRGFTPYKSTSLSSAEHTAIVSLEGYVTKEVRFRTHQGFKLIIYLGLKKDDKIIVALPTPTLELSTYVEILPTSTGFLRVRNEPSTVAAEVAQIKPGDTFKRIDKNTETGWYKIEYDEGLYGWVSNQYAKIVSDVTASPTTNAKLTPTTSPTPEN